MDRNEEALYARIPEKQQRRMIHALTKEQIWAVRAIAGLSPKWRRRSPVADRTTPVVSISTSIDPFFIFNYYIRNEDSKGKGGRG